MATATTPSKRKRLKKKPAGDTLMVRLDAESKSLLQKAANLRRTSVSEYVRMIMVAQARREIDAAAQNLIVMSPEGQLAFWKALHEPPVLTPELKRLGRIMRGEE